MWLSFEAKVDGQWDLFMWQPKNGQPVGDKIRISSGKGADVRHAGLPLLSSEELEKAAEELGVSPIAVAVVWMGNLRPLKWSAKLLSDRLRSHYHRKVNQIHYAAAALNASPLPGEIVSAPVCRTPRLRLVKNEARHSSD